MFYYAVAVLGAIVGGVAIIAYLENRFLGNYLYFLLVDILAKNDEVRKKQNKIQTLKFWQTTKIIFIFVFIYLIAAWIFIPKLLAFPNKYLNLWDVAMAVLLLIVGWGELKLLIMLYSIKEEIKRNENLNN